MDPIENIDNLRIGLNVTFIKEYSEYILTKRGTIVKKEESMITIQTEPKVMYKVSFNNATFYNFPNINIH
jgi:RNase P/RNase MRP subunit p29